MAISSSNPIRCIESAEEPQTEPLLANSSHVGVVQHELCFQKGSRELMEP
jgi:hypothetical protein